MRKINLPISGMHCRSCELLLEDEIKAVPGVSKVVVSQKKAAAEIEYEGSAPEQTALENAITKAGYAVGVGKKRPLMSRNANDYAELIIAAGSLFILYVIARVTGVFDTGVSFGSAPSYGVVMLVGLTAGISTCMALIGGLVLALSAEHRKKHPEASRMQNFRPHLYFNLGRIIGFALLGGLIGILGSVFKLSGSVLGSLVIVAGIVMIVLGLKLIGIFPRLEGKGLTMPRWIMRLFGVKTEVKEYSHRGAMATGLLTFFLPCGFTQAMQIYAVSTGSFAQGALIMGLFALGTAPGLLGIGGVASAVKGSFGRVFFKFAGVLVLIFGMWNLSAGYNLTGIVFSEGKAADVRVELPEMIDGYQIVHMTQEAYAYVPNEITVKKGVPVRWVVTSENPYTCASFLTIPALRFATRLSEGENVIEFTPTQAGPLRFTCSMGMFSGRFNVVE